MQNPVPIPISKTSNISKKPGFLSEKLESIEFNIFCWNFAHVLYLVMRTKGCMGLFLFCLGLKLLMQVLKTSV